MSCAEYRESLSALLDGEPPVLPEAAVQAHVADCQACADWYEAAARVTRLVRLAPAEPVPDRTASVLDRSASVLDRTAGRPAASPPRAGRLVAVLRAALVLLAFVQAVLAWPGAVLGRDAMAAGHVAHEVGAWNLALAVAFLAAASRPRSAGALVAPVGVFVAVLTVATITDAVAGTVQGGRLVAHLLVATALGLLVAVTRLAGSLPGVPPAGGTRLGLAVAADGSSPDLTAVAGPVPRAHRPSVRTESVA